MPSLHVHSNDGGALVIEPDGRPEPWYWHVTLRSHGLDAAADVDTDLLLHHASPIGDYFTTLAENWRGWTGTHCWGMQTLSLAATHDGLGHVYVRVELRHGVNPEDWTAHATMQLDAGGLDDLARQAARLPL